MYHFPKFLAAAVIMSVLSTPVLYASENGIRAGFEIDALPYLTGGFYGSLWAGRDGWRTRAVISQVNIPEFSIRDGYEDAEMRAYALIFDRFFGSGSREFAGPWAGVGMEYWENSIRREGHIGSAEYDQTVFTFGCGYVWKFHGNFSLNPWAAVHARIGGDERVPVSGAVYRPAALLGEGSVKLGWSF